MSHFGVVAILPLGLDPSDMESIQTYLDETMEPYNENTSVGEYEHDCYCVESMARSWVNDQMRQKFDQHWEDTLTGERYEDWDDIPRTAEPLFPGMGGEALEVDRKRFKQRGGLDDYRDSFGPITEAIRAKYSFTGPDGKTLPVPGQFGAWPEAYVRNHPDWTDLEEQYRLQEEEIQAAWAAHIAPYQDAENGFRLQYEAEFGSQPDPMCGFFTQEIIDRYSGSTEHGGQMDRWVEGKKAGDPMLDDDGNRDYTEHCYGSGKVKSTYNPESKWDWWVIGGRWDGELAGLEEITPMEVCNLCGGSGKRTDELGNAARLDNPEYTCNGCGGKGERQKWPTDEEYQSPNRNIIRLADSKPEAPYAYITPDGVWHGQGQMGWFGMTSGDEDHDTWNADYTQVRADYAECFAVQLDCHI